MEIKCEICGLNNAQVKDYRNNGVSYGKYFVCKNCFWMNDIWFFKLKHAIERISKQRIVSQIIEGMWKNYLVDKN